MGIGHAVDGVLLSAGSVCGRVGNWPTVIFFQQNLLFWPQTIELFF
jgi:hypothetical protein